MSDDLRRLLEFLVKLPQFKRDFQTGGSQETYCNLLARAALNSVAARLWTTWAQKYKPGAVPDYLPTDFLYDISAMNPSKPLGDIMMMTSVSTAYHNVMRMAESGLRTGETHDQILPEQADKYPIEISPERAQELANQGIPIWGTSEEVCKGGHEVIVYPCNDEYSSKRGPKIAQAGWWNGIFFASEWQAFGDYWNMPLNDIKFYLFPKERA
jgi:hypothetical protein